MCGWSGDWAEAGGWGHEHGLGEAYGRRGGARCLYTPVCQVWSALLDHRAVRREPGRTEKRFYSGPGAQTAVNDSTHT